MHTLLEDLGTSEQNQIVDADLKEKTAMEIYGIGECWGDFLKIINSEGEPRLLRDRLEELAVNVLGHVRIMVKFEDVSLKGPQIIRSEIDDMVQTAQELGLYVNICTDWHNKAGGPGSYHQSLDEKVLNNYSLMQDLVEAILEELQPDMLQVCNEPFYRKKSLPPLTEDLYAEYVEAHVRALKSNGDRSILLIADSPYSTPTRDPFKSWVFRTHKANPLELSKTVTWDKCAESLHVYYVGDWEKPSAITSTMVHSLPDAKSLSFTMHSCFWLRDRDNCGVMFPVFHDEVSPVGKVNHINSPTGYAMTKVMLDIFTEKNIPCTWLSLGGTNPWWGQEPGTSGWGLNTDMINSKGELSLGGIAVLDHLNKEVSWQEEEEEPVEFKGLEPALRFVRRFSKLGFSAKRARHDSKLRKAYKEWLKQVGV